MPMSLGNKRDTPLGRYSCRAELHSARLGSQTSVGLWGYSGGALASGWAAELQPSYAPELNIKGVAEGGMPVNPANVLKGANGGPFAGIAMSGIAGLCQAYPQLAEFLDTYLTAEGKAALAKARTQCNSGKPSADTDRIVGDYCADGARVKYHDMLALFGRPIGTGN